MYPGFEAQKKKNKKIQQKLYKGVQALGAEVGAEGEAKKGSGPQPGCFAIQNSRRKKTLPPPRH